MKTSKLIIFGTEDFAQIAYEYFTYDSDYEVVAFTGDHIKDTELCGIPVVPFDEIESLYPPETHDIFCAIVYGDMNRTRENVCKRAKIKRYELASYISSRAFVWRNVILGEHCFIFENNVLQPFVNIGDNCILWSGNHVGHHSIIGSSVFLSSHVVVSGWCDIGNNCFVGVNSTLANNTKIGKESWIMHGTILNGVIPENSIVKSSPSLMGGLNEDALSRALKKASEDRK